jgi:protein-S-isoprenylcysteine O-methyltransferase Ste14
VSTVEAQLIYGLAWVSFGAGHSLLAGGAAKARLGGILGGFYRFAYNLLATAHIAGVWAIGRWAFADAAPFSSPTWIDTARVAAYVAGWLLMVWALGGYDLGRFAGTRQIRNHFRGIEEPEDEPLRLDGLHRYVRHPVYAGAYLILWGNVAGPFELATAVWGSLYLAAGTAFEERRLLALYGGDYADYRRRVPSVIPWKGRVL